MSSTELVRSRVLTTTETYEEGRAFTGTFGKVAGKAVYSTLLGLVSAVNDAYNKVQSTKLPVDAQRLYWMPSSVVRVVRLASKEDGKLYTVLGKYTAGYLARVVVGLEQGVNMVLNLTSGYNLPFDEKAWKGLLRNLSCVCLGLNSAEMGKGFSSVAVGTLGATLQSLCTRLCNLVEFTIERAYSDVEHGSLLPDKYVSRDTPSLEEAYGIPSALLKYLCNLVEFTIERAYSDVEHGSLLPDKYVSRDTPSLEEAYGIPSALLKYQKNRGKSEPEETETEPEAELNDFEEREVMSVEDSEDIECVEEPENAEPEGLEEETEEADGSLCDDDGRLLRIPTDEECSQLLQEMEVRLRGY